MSEANAGVQSVRRQARQAAVAAQARRRAKTAERDKRLESAAITLMVALRERDAVELHAGATIRAMLSDELSLVDVVTWTDMAPSLEEHLAGAADPFPPEPGYGDGDGSFLSRLPRSPGWQIRLARLTGGRGVSAKPS